MKNISLLKVSLFVATAAIFSSFTSANDTMQPTVSSVQAELFSPQEISFEDLSEALDGDKDGLLSREEVIKFDNKYLLDVYTQIDINEDNQIDDKEFNSFMSASKSSAE